MFDFIKKFFKKNEAHNQSIESNNDVQIAKTESVKHITQNRTALDLQSEIVLLWLLSQKKDPTFDNFKVTKKVETRYNLNLANGLQQLIDEKLISNVNGKLIIEEGGFLKLKEYNCYIIMHLHPEYDLSYSDFSDHPHWHNINDNDIVWGIFNGRIMQYTKEKMWTSLKNNYCNMASLLIEESKYEKALDFLFAAAFIETSGMMDENTVTTYVLEINNYDITVPLLNISKKISLSVEDLHKRYLESQFVLSLRDLLPFYYYDIDDACIFMLEAYKHGDTKGIFTEQMLKIELKKNIPDKNETQKYSYNSSDNILKKHFES